MKGLERAYGKVYSKSAVLPSEILQVFLLHSQASLPSIRYGGSTTHYLPNDYSGCVLRQGKCRHHRMLRSCW